jgi:hypothetical protein
MHMEAEVEGQGGSDEVGVEAGEGVVVEEVSGEEAWVGVGREVDAEGEDGEGSGEAEAEEELAVGNEGDDKGPDEVELLLLAEGPEVADGGVEAMAVGGDVEEERGVGVVSGGSGGHVEVAEVDEEGEVIPVPDGMQEGCDGEEDGPDEEEDGQDAEGSSDIKRSKEAGEGAGVEEDAGDEEAGEDEEEVDGGEAPEEDVVESGPGEGAEVGEADGEDGEAAEAVEGGIVGAEER